MSTSTQEDLVSEPLSYFSHDADSLCDFKMQKLIMRYGFEGYGRFWAICEMLARQRGHSIPFDTDDDIDAITFSLRFQDSKFCTSFIGFLADCGLISQEALGEGRIMSERMCSNAAYCARKRNAGMAGGKTRQAKIKQDQKSA